jgi:hypothetical protein
MNTSMADIAARNPAPQPGRTYRFKTLLRLCGKPRALKTSQEHPAKIAPRVLTVHHGEGSAAFDHMDGTPFFGPGSRVNVAGVALFPKPLPADCGHVVGISQHAERGMF